MLFALVGGWIYSGWIRGDRLARFLTLWGVLGGAIGFPLGQSLQAWHAWNREWFRTGPWAGIDPYLNWWNWMETTFGAVMGAFLGLGLWLHRRRIQLPPASAVAKSSDSEIAPPAIDATASVAPSAGPGGFGTRLPLPAEHALLALHLGLLMLSEFGSVSAVDLLYDHGILMGLIPMVAVAGGVRWPFLLVLPVTLLPIAGKTARAVVYGQGAIDFLPGLLIYVALPILVTTVVAGAFAKRENESLAVATFAGPVLLLCTWVYFGLNFAFFQFPWPWADWTARTPNALAFTLCAAVLTFAAVTASRRESPP
jgi:hypothetical protein